MQRTAKARFQSKWVSPVTVIRVSTTCAGRRQILGGMSGVESSHPATAFRAAADWRSLARTSKIGSVLFKSLNLVVEEYSAMLFTIGES